jgi:hypothetical protein
LEGKRRRKTASETVLTTPRTRAIVAREAALAAIAAAKQAEEEANEAEASIMPHSTKR